VTTSVEEMVALVLDLSIKTLPFSAEKDVDPGQAAS